MRYFLLFLVIVSLSSCSKRSNCPTYWDSDPKMLFGEKPVAEILKDRAGVKDTKRKEKSKLKKGYSKRARKKNTKLFKKRRNKDMGKRNKRKKKKKVTEGAGG